MDDFDPLSEEAKRPTIDQFDMQPQACPLSDVPKLGQSRLVRSEPGPIRERQQVDIDQDKQCENKSRTVRSKLANQFQ